VRKLTGQILWLLIAIYALAVLLPPLFPKLESPINAAINTVTLCAFALIHASIRYRARDITVFVVVCLVISNFMENLSIMTGIPFGHYYYSDALGPKLFLVPLLIGPAYFGTGYIAWTMANVFLDIADRRKDRLSVLGLPVIAAFVMASWDFCLDPTNATIDKQWIWQNGGGYFGVPYGNFLGWILTVYVFYQLFAFYLSKQPAIPHAEIDKTYWYQAACLLLVIALHFQADFVGLPDKAVTDPTGRVWQTGDIYTTGALASIFTLIFASVLGFIKIARMEKTSGF
jgi:uncharacterized membrane protein